MTAINEDRLDQQVSAAMSPGAAGAGAALQELRAPRPTTRDGQPHCGLPASPNHRRRLWRYSATHIVNLRKMHRPLRSRPSRPVGWPRCCTRSCQSRTVSDVALVDRCRGLRASTTGRPGTWLQAAPAEVIREIPAHTTDALAERPDELTYAWPSPGAPPPALFVRRMGRRERGRPGRRLGRRGGSRPARSTWTSAKASHPAPGDRRDRRRRSAVTRAGGMTDAAAGPRHMHATLVATGSGRR